MLYFLDCLEVLIKKLEKKYETFNSIGPYLNSRQKEVVAFITKAQPVKVGDIARALEGYTIHSIRKDLQYLYQEGVVDRLGKGKGVVYFLSPSENEEN